jgi:pimeloyl-ACP methyl ester carboxylesterase
MKILTFFFVLFLSSASIGQLQEPIAGYAHFQLVHKRDTIDFVVADTNLSVVKPVLLFCQGSQPVPLFIDFGAEGLAPVPLNNFNLPEMKQHYHVVAISMPKTPVVVTPAHLNRAYNYVLDTAQEYSYSPEFIEADYLENYIRRANRVIQFLIKQKWVDKTSIVVAGHSQGSRVAVGIAHTNKRVTKLGLFGYNPMRRIDQLIWSYRKQAQNDEITWEQADSLQQAQYAFFEDMLNEDSLKRHAYLRSWRSFSTSSIDELTHLEIPVYIAFGSLDIVAEYCDVLPLDFAEMNKTNYVLKRYPNVEHNFFPLDENFRPDYANGMWREVMDSFITWSLE